MDGNNTRIALNRKNNTADTAIVKTLTLQLFADPPQKFLPHSALAYSPNRRYIAGPVPWQTVSPSLISIEVSLCTGILGIAAAPVMWRSLYLFGVFVAYRETRVTRASVPHQNHVQ